MSTFKKLSHQDNTLVLYDDVLSVYAEIRVLEASVINVRVNKNKTIELPTWTITPGDTELPFEGLSRNHLEAFSLPAYECVETDHEITITTSALKLLIQKNGFYLTWYQKNSDGQFEQVMRDRHTQSYQHHLGDNQPTCHYLMRNIDDKYFGLGEKSGGPDRHGRRLRMNNIDAMGYNAETTDPLYKHIPFYITYMPALKQSIGIYYDDYQNSVFDFGQELDNYHGHYRYFETNSTFLDYYVIAGPRIKEVTERFSWLTGRPAKMPEWASMYSGSTMQYTDMPNSHERLSDYLDQCHQHNINVRSFHLSSGYTSIDGKRYVYNWNYDKFPDPEAFGREFTEKGVEIVANIKPSLMVNHPLLHEVTAFDGFIKDEHGKPLLVQFWDDEGYYLDFTNPRTINWWQKKIKTQLLDNHIHCTWNDNNEFEIWDQKAQVHGFGEGGNFQDYRAVMPLLMMKASREAQLAHNGTEDPYIISRSGCAGMSKYVQTWTGDNYTSWKTLKFNNKMAQGLSLSGIYNFGHDLGGFSGPKPDSELFLRWIQCGIFYPRFSIHSWNNDGSVNEPWMHEDVLESVKYAMHLHDRLAPYIQSLVERSHSHYEPIIRPVFYDFENDTNAFDDSDAFMLGSMLVSPVVEQGQQSKEIYLPDCEDGWVDFFTGEHYSGNTTIKIDVSLSDIPVFVKKGNVIPMYNDALIEVENHEF
ncbi:TIM-barrel domain-containing protein [Corticicoccus populi]|uniref:TIM-barrel domain-containing protein n=1 Tax=Corticicoccus populi TaxID=1812821 RepID=A0ABW5WT46_9STAP